MGVLPGSDERVTCIACGDSLPREEAREYDKFGDRWDRDGKRFEHLCKGCFGDLSNAPRDGVEALLVEAGAGDCDRATFLARYVTALGEADTDPSRKA